MRQPVGLALRGEDHLVLTFLRAEEVEKDVKSAGLALELLTRLRTARRAVEEARGVGEPCGRRELGPLDHIGQKRLLIDVEDPPGQPVRARVCGRVGEEPPVRRRHGVDERDSAVIRERVRVDEYLSVSARAVHDVEDRLWLEAGVAVLEPPSASLEGNAEPWVVPQLVDATCDLLAAGDGLEPRVGEAILGFDEASRLLRRRVLEPPEWIGDGLAVVVIDLRAERGWRVLKVHSPIIHCWGRVRPQSAAAGLLRLGFR